MENLIKDFYKSLEECGISKDCTLEYEREDDIVQVVFYANLGDNSLCYYDVFFEEFENETNVNIIASKKLESENKLEILETVNKLNIDYDLIKFYTTSDYACVCTKIFLPCCEDAVTIINALGLCMEVASSEFVNFK